MTTISTSSNERKVLRAVLSQESPALVAKKSGLEVLGRNHHKISHMDRGQHTESLMSGLQSRGRGSIQDWSNGDLWKRVLGVSKKKKLNDPVLNEMWQLVIKKGKWDEEVEELSGGVSAFKKGAVAEEKVEEVEKKKKKIEEEGLKKPSDVKLSKEERKKREDARIKKELSKLETDKRRAEKVIQEAERSSKGLETKLRQELKNVLSENRKLKEENKEISKLKEEVKKLNKENIDLRFYKTQHPELDTEEEETTDEEEEEKDYPDRVKIRSWRQPDPDDPDPSDDEDEYLTEIEWKGKDYIINLKNDVAYDDNFNLYGKIIRDETGKFVVGIQEFTKEEKEEREKLAEEEETTTDEDITGEEEEDKPPPSPPPPFSPVTKMNIQDIRDRLEEMGLDTSGDKAEILGRLNDARETERREASERIDLPVQAQVAQKSNPLFQKEKVVSEAEEKKRPGPAEWEAGREAREKAEAENTDESSDESDIETDESDIESQSSDESDIETDESDIETDEDDLDEIDLEGIDYLLNSDNNKIYSMRGEHVGDWIEDPGEIKWLESAAEAKRFHMEHRYGAPAPSVPEGVGLRAEKTTPQKVKSLSSGGSITRGHFNKRIFTMLHGGELVIPKKYVDDIMKESKIARKVSKEPPVYETLKFKNPPTIN